MYVYGQQAALLPAAGATMMLWWPLAGFALFALGLALMRAAFTFRRDGQ